MDGTMMCQSHKRNESVYNARLWFGSRATSSSVSIARPNTLVWESSLIKLERLYRSTTVPVFPVSLFARPFGDCLASGDRLWARKLGKARLSCFLDQMGGLAGESSTVLLLRPSLSTSICGHSPSA
jgi:hypothetical protein